MEPIVQVVAFARGEVKKLIYQKVPFGVYSVKPHEAPPPHISVLSNGIVSHVGLFAYLLHLPRGNLPCVYLPALVYC